MVSFTSGKPSEDWIRDTLRYRGGRRSMKALRNQFRREGNDTMKTSEVERLCESLQYKNESSMAFELFLTKCQKMYNIFEEEGEKMEDYSKTCFIFKQVDQSDLQKSIETLKSHMANQTFMDSIIHYRRLSFKHSCF